MTTEKDEKPKAGAIDLATVNKFKALSGPCLVCGKMPPGLAFGITPDQAVCADDFTDNPDEAQEALEAAARGEKPKRVSATRRHASEPQAKKAA